MSRIEVRSLSKNFGHRTAVEGLDFEVGAGEVFGLLGPNGAGKTTTVRMLTGLLRPSSGRAIVCGVPLDGEPGVEVVLGREVAVDGALRVLGALGDLLDGHRLPVVAVEERQRRVEQRPLAAPELALLALGGADGRSPLATAGHRRMRRRWLTGRKRTAGQPLAPWCSLQRHSTGSEWSACTSAAPASLSIRLASSRSSRLRPSQAWVVRVTSTTL